MHGKLLAFLFCVVPAITLAQSTGTDQAKPQQSEDQKVADAVVIMPRALIEIALEWIRKPDPTNAVDLYSGLIACLNNNPKDGSITRFGPDQCPVVTKALAARETEIEKLSKVATKPASPPETKK